MGMKVFNILFIILFMAALLVPLMFVNLQGGEVSEQENRMLAARPPISYAFERPNDFIRQFDNWFTDNVGFRQTMLNLYQYVKRLENQIEEPRGSYMYLVGENDHEFLAFSEGDYDLIPKFQGKPFLSSEQLYKLSDGLNDIEQYLNDRNIPFIVMFCTDKETVYPEYYPKSIVRSPEPVQLDIITEWVKENTDIDIFNTRKCLTEKKENYLLYNQKYDIGHYNEIGAFFAYQELMRHINVYMPEMKPFTINDIEISFDEEHIPIVSLKHTVTYEKLEQDFFNDAELERPFTWQNTAFTNHDDSLPTILFMRDSFIGYTDPPNFLSKYIPEHFGKTILIQYTNMEHFSEYVDLYNPDIVVFETVERSLALFVDSITRWEP